MISLELLLGAIIGLIMAVTGAGGGVIGVPLLVLAGGLTMQEAIPISMMAVTFAAMLGSGIGFSKGLVRYRAAILIAALGGVLSPLGLWVAHQINSQWLQMLFAILLILVAISGFRKEVVQESLHLPCIRHAESGRFKWTSPCAAMLAGTGALAGFMAGLLGVGGGFVIVPAIMRYTDLDMSSVIATSLTVMALIALSVMISAIASDRMDISLGLTFGAGAIIGLLVGNQVSGRMNKAQVQKVFSVLLLVVAVVMASNSLLH